MTKNMFSDNVDDDLADDVDNKEGNAFEIKNSL